MRRLAFAIFAALITAPVAGQNSPQAPAAAQFIPSEASDVVSKLADALDSDFVDPEAGHQYSAMLRKKLAAGGYSNFADSKAFATAVTADLQAVHKDAHLRLLAPATGKSGERKSAMIPPEDSTILASGWLAPGVAYISFSAFYGNDKTLAALKAFLDQARGAKTLIIDARQHRGGGLWEMDVLFPELFAAKTGLLDMDTREAVFKAMGDAFEDEPTVTTIAGPASVVRQRHYAVPAANPGLADAKVYILTSAKTASAAEHMTLALKRTHRATIVGETTRGAGNYGHPADLGHGYSAFIPVGRTFDPDTGLGWEATGVAPDVAVPADKALDKALELAGVAKTSADALASLR
jgi:hypothetical protein